MILRFRRWLWDKWNPTTLWFHEAYEIWGMPEPVWVSEIMARRP